MNAEYRAACAYAEQSAAHTVCLIRKAMQAGTEKEKGKLLTELLTDRFAARTVPELWEAGALTLLLPELIPEEGYCQENPWHSLTLAEHTREVYRHLPAGAPPALRFAALMHDTGKPECAVRGDDGYLHFPKHPYASFLIAEKACARLCLPPDFSAEACMYVRYHDICAGEESEVLSFCRKFGKRAAQNLFLLKEADAAAQSDYGKELRRSRLNAGEETVRMYVPPESR